jgi:RNA polymerase sigma-70 factor (ECF subfamily)
LPDGVRRTLGDDLPAAEGLDPRAGFEEAEYRQEVLRRAMALIRRDFQPITWDVWREHVVVGRPAAEVAAQFEVTVNAVYLTKSRVLRRLREEFDGLLE